MYEELYPLTYYFYPLLEGVGRTASVSLMHETLALPELAPRESLLYVHVPYCHDMCRFCPFHVRVAQSEEVFARYTDALCREIRALASEPRVATKRFSAVYFGGGSPSILTVPMIGRIYDTIERNLSLTPQVEISFEGEPRTLGNLDLLHMLREHRTSRISFGLQTFDQVQRDRFNINATLDDVERCTRNAFDLGFEDVNVDMMYDLPGQTLAELDGDLRRVGEMGFTSVDYYNLHYFAFPSSFMKKIAEGAIPPKPDDAMHFRLAERVREGLAELGLHDVADQVFSRHSKVCEYFRLLWGGGRGDHQAETVAVGASARGYIDGRSYMNESNTAAYLTTVESGQLPIAKVSRPLPRPENRGAVFMPKFFRFDREFDAARQTIDEEVWADWQQWGLVEEDARGWRVTDRGKPWTTNMMLDAFDTSQRDTARQSLTKLRVKPGVRTGSF